MFSRSSGAGDGESETQGEDMLPLELSQSDAEESKDKGTADDATISDTIKNAIMFFIVIFNTVYLRFDLAFSTMNNPIVTMIRTDAIAPIDDPFAVSGISLVLSPAAVIVIVPPAEDHVMSLISVAEVPDHVLKDVAVLSIDTALDPADAVFLA
jgi:hypothetical protein